MTEDQINTEASSQITKPVREPLTKTGFDRARESIKKAQDTGSWPKKETPQSMAVTSDTVEKTYPTEKMYPKKEVREEKLDSFPNQQPTIPSEIKGELTKEAEKLNTMKMETRREIVEKKTELPQVKPFAEKKAVPPPPAQAPETIKAQGGAEPLRRIMKAQKEMEQETVDLQKTAPERTKTRIEQKQVKVPSEAKDYIPPSQIPLKKPVPQPAVEPAAQEATQALKTEKKPFFSRTFDRIFGKK